MARKGYENLSEKYRQRLLRHGIGKPEYESGAPLQKARGHENEGQWTKHALDDGLGLLIDDYAELPRAERERLGHWYVRGYMTEGHRDRTRLRMKHQFDEWTQEHGMEFGRSEWRIYRDLYRIMIRGQ